MALTTSLGGNGINLSFQEDRELVHFIETGRISSLLPVRRQGMHLPLVL